MIQVTIKIECFVVIETSIPPFNRFHQHSSTFLTYLAANRQTHRYAVHDNVITANLGRGHNLYTACLFCWNLWNTLINLHVFLQICTQLHIFAIYMFSCPKTRWNRCNLHALLLEPIYHKQHEQQYDVNIRDSSFSYKNTIFVDRKSPNITISIYVQRSTLTTSYNAQYHRFIYS